MELLILNHPVPRNKWYGEYALCMHVSHNYWPSQALTVFRSCTSSGAPASLAHHSLWPLQWYCCSTQLCSAHTRLEPTSDFHLGYCFTSFRSWLDVIFSVTLSQNILFPIAVLNPYLADIIVLCFVFLCNTSTVTSIWSTV